MAEKEDKDRDTERQTLINRGRDRDEWMGTRKDREKKRKDEERQRGRERAREIKRERCIGRPQKDSKTQSDRERDTQRQCIANGGIGKQRQKE